MVVDTDESVRSSFRRSPSRLWRGLVAVVLVVAGGSWIAIQIQTECEAVARQAIFGYSDALNAGDAVLAAEAFDDTAGFSWYSENPGRVGDDARNRHSISGYLADRIAQDVKLRILFFDFNAESPVNVLGHFGFHAFNESWDLISGKGAVSCDTGTVTVLSIGGS